MEHERGKCEGYWEWFRKDGTKMRSDYFKKGKQTGKWNTFDAREIFYGFLGTENLLDFLVLKIQNPRIFFKE